jgi:hypothetical protein|uniref:Uncharacterized protein n=1 Tax=Siphoviridae sp. ct16C7 TaxID=2825304 RepID=A0A8S5NZD9_9CAUD|nr:MAG TPA: hypothetical protein [Siphoviridae sp. ct16C7]
MNILSTFGGFVASFRILTAMLEKTEDKMRPLSFRIFRCVFWLGAAALILGFVLYEWIKWGLL